MTPHVDASPKHKFYDLIFLWPKTAPLPRKAFPLVEFVLKSDATILTPQLTEFITFKAERRRRKGIYSKNKMCTRGEKDRRQNKHRVHHGENSSELFIREGLARHQLRWISLTDTCTGAFLPTIFLNERRCMVL